MPQESVTLTRFKNDFVNKFDQQAIPLLKALDPEIGVSYGNLEAYDDGQHLLKDIYQGSVPEQSSPVNWSKTHRLLQQKWSGFETITLTLDDIKELKQDGKRMPQSISVVFRLVEGLVFLEQAGGVTATSLIGRFTPFNDKIHALAKAVATQESLANPGIIFAEIAHVCHKHTANIDRRQHIYPYEIPVLVQTELHRNQLVLLSDLWIAVRQGEIILWSRKHGKRVIPRLSSAFNYTRNDLAIFRFLCDMQHQSINTSISFDMSRIFPDLAFYPRVTYERTILQLARWIIKQEKLLPAVKAGATKRYELFDLIRSELHLPKYVALTQYDNQLVFDLDIPKEVDFFLDTIKGYPEVTLKEFLLPGDGQSHVTQYIASLYHTSQLYQPIAINDIGIPKKTSRKFLPGSEWLYLKIYCHPARASELLSDPIHKLVKRCTQACLVAEWFFIRYNDPEHHLRLRLKVNTGGHQLVLAEVLKVMLPLINEGLVTRYTTDIYERELERYSADEIDQIESVFTASTTMVLAYLRSASPLNAEKVLVFALISTKDMLISSGLTGMELIVFLEQIAVSFVAEFEFIPDLKHRLDTEYRKQKIAIERSLQNPDESYRHWRLKKKRVMYIHLLNGLSKNTRRLADLIHMHLNRLFMTDARKQEMAIYYFLLKYERSMLARRY